MRRKALGRWIHIVYTLCAGPGAQRLKRRAQPSQLLKALRLPETIYHKKDSKLKFEIAKSLHEYGEQASAY